jgi:HEAT repeat protein
MRAFHSSLTATGLLALAGYTAQAMPDEAPKPARGESSLSPADVGFSEKSSDELGKMVSEGSEAEYQIARRNLRLRGAKAAPTAILLLSSTQRRGLETGVELLEAMGSHRDAETLLLELFKAEKILDLDDENRSRLRRRIALLLGQIGSEKARSIFLEGLKKPQLSLREQELLRSGLAQTPRAALSELIKVYLENAKARNIELQSQLLIVIGNIGGDDARSTLLAALSNTGEGDSIVIRHHAILGLDQLNDPVIIPNLIEQLTVEKNHYLCQYITRVLQRLTNQDLPPDAARWLAWWKLEQRAKAKPTGEAPSEKEAPKLDMKELIENIKKQGPGEGPPKAEPEKAKSPSTEPAKAPGKGN